MTNIIKEIRKIIGVNNNTSDIKFEMFSDNTMTFSIYEVEIPIVIDIKSQIVYLDCDTYDGHITTDMMEELTKIIKLLEKNFSIFYDLVK